MSLFLGGWGYLNALIEAVRTNNSVIVFFVCLAVVIILAGNKIIKAISEANKVKAEIDDQKTRTWMDREREVLRVIQNNAESITKMSEVLDGLKDYLKSANSQQNDIFNNFDKDHKEILLGVNEIRAKLGSERDGK